MANSIDIVVPDLGDFSDVEVIEVLVSAGDRVAREDGLITLETDKASMDVPSPEDGVIESLSVSAGDSINSGDVIGRMSVAGASAEQPESDPEQEEEVSAPQEPSVEAPEAPARPGGERTLTVPDIGDFDDVDVIEVHIAEGQVIGAEDS
ncbi:MAG: dihydrolipoamide acetyltransferase, partial [Gammaproteobacteria bacterium]|nr:dihydrolipoamide acetyltransferase [Gammaproteobacteria bacterium]